MNKLAIFESFYSAGDVLVTLNTNTDGLDIPSNLRSQEIVDFILGQTPTPKLTADDHGVSTPMRFSGSLYNCYFPWSAIVQMSGQDAVIQFRNPDLSKTSQPAKKVPQESSVGGKRANLRLVK